MTPAASVFISLGKHVHSSVVNFTGVPSNLHSLQFLAWGGGNYVAQQAVCFLLIHERERERGGGNYVAQQAVCFLLIHERERERGGGNYVAQQAVCFLLIHERERERGGGG